MFVVRNNKIGKLYLVFGARANIISLSYLTFGAIRDMIANESNYPDNSFYPTRIG